MQALTLSTIKSQGSKVVSSVLELILIEWPVPSENVFCL